MLWEGGKKGSKEGRFMKKIGDGKEKERMVVGKEERVGSVAGKERKKEEIKAERMEGWREGGQGH